MNHSAQIVVLGGGPAGGATAIGLTKLGYSVTLITEPRPFKAVEGISERVVEGLRGAGFNKALQNLPEPSPRLASWNGEANSANTERLINRTALDTGILEDLADAGVTIVHGRVSRVRSESDGHQVELKDNPEVISADFLVEARGRAAPGAGLTRMRGTETVSLLQYWQGEPCKPQSAAESFQDGWAWMAAWSDGTRYLQLTFDVGSADLPAKAQLVDYCNRILATLPGAASFMVNAAPTGEIHARTSTPILCNEPVGDNWIRVGDAAMAVDPLSGNGIFQALSSALQAPAVINTLFNRPENAELAKRFYQQRVEHLFYRFARIGRDFYAMEQRWPTLPFWQRRGHWPDDQPLHQVTDPDSVQVATMPVVSNGYIHEAEVVVTNDQPLGTWHLNGLAMAPVVRALQTRSPDQTVSDCLEQQGMPAKTAKGLHAWLLHNRWITDRV